MWAKFKFSSVAYLYSLSIYQMLCKQTKKLTQRKRSINECLIEYSLVLISRRKGFVDGDAGFVGFLYIPVRPRFTVFKWGVRRS